MRHFVLNCEPLSNPKFKTDQARQIKDSIRSCSPKEFQQCQVACQFEICMSLQAWPSKHAGCTCCRRPCCIDVAWAGILSLLLVLLLLLDRGMKLYCVGWEEFSTRKVTATAHTHTCAHANMWASVCLRAWMRTCVFACVHLCVCAV